MAKIFSKKQWNDTGFTVVKGRTYRYAASGTWKDFFITCDANGFSNIVLDLFSWTKRHSSAQWFQLIGVVEQNAQYTIVLGTKGEFTAPASGKLWAYANDALFAYGNNAGDIDLLLEDITS